MFPPRALLGSRRHRPGRRRPAPCCPGCGASRAEAVTWRSCVSRSGPDRSHRSNGGHQTPPHPPGLRRLLLLRAVSNRAPSCGDRARAPIEVGGTGAWGPAPPTAPLAGDADPSHVAVGRDDDDVPQLIPAMTATATTRTRTDHAGDRSHRRPEGPVQPSNRTIMIGNPGFTSVRSLVPGFARIRGWAGRTRSQLGTRPSNPGVARLGERFERLLCCPVGAPTGAPSSGGEERR
jgi:hypothetical protein